ncbi:MAG: serine protease [Lysobacterales bacterium]
MNLYKKSSRILTLNRVSSSLCGVLFCLVATPSLSALNETAIHQSMVRVEANGHFGSGFLYGGEDHVVTSLHVVLPPPQTIEIYCKGSPVKAEVVKFLIEADLVLLKAKSSLESEGCKPYPGLKEDLNRPNLGEDLAAFGFREDNHSSAFPKLVKKGSGSPETLEGLVSEKAIDSVRKFGIPRADLPLYHISGGLYPGLSGGPVFLLSSGDLVGIVEGGLDAGASNHAWLVPVSNLANLMASPDNSVLPDKDPSEFGYSSPSSKRTPDIVIEYSDPDNSYSWVKTKTRTFEDLLDSSDPSEGLDNLVSEIFPDLKSQEARDTVESAMLSLKFDIYEEREHGLIVAVPAGVSLDVTEYIGGDAKGYHFLSVGNRYGGTGFHINYGEPNLGDISDANGQTVLPSEDRYLEQVLHDWMYDLCVVRGYSCYFDKQSAKVVDFGENRKLLRFSYYTKNTMINTVEYNSISVLVSGDRVLQVENQTDYSGPPDPDCLDDDYIESAVRQCMQTTTTQNCGKPYWDQVAFMLAARLSSFTNLGVTTEQTRSIDLNYDCEFCIKSSNTAKEFIFEYTDAHIYNYGLEDGTDIFRKDENGQWWFNEDGEWLKLEFIEEVEFENQPYTRLRREDGSLYQMTVEGGLWYHWFDSENEWVPQYKLGATYQVIKR